MKTDCNLCSCCSLCTVWLIQQPRVSVTSSHRFITGVISLGFFWRPQFLGSDDFYGYGEKLENLIPCNPVAPKAESMLENLSVHFVNLNNPESGLRQLSSPRPTHTWFWCPHRSCCQTTCSAAASSSPSERWQIASTLTFLCCSGLVLLDLLRSG